MPEGDTIYRAARTLQTALAGKRVTRFESVLPQLIRVDDDAPLAGRTIERVRASGKNLIIDFSGDLHLHTHMRMHGTWHIYRPGERWRKRRSDMRIVLETDDWIAVAFNAPVAEFHDARSLERQEDLHRIGPDLLGESFDLEEAMRRIRERASSEIADVIINQRVVSGMGNEYKIRSAVPRADPSVCASARRQRRADRVDAAHGAEADARERAQAFAGTADHVQPRPVAAEVRVRPRAEAVPQMWDADRIRAARARCPRDLLVSEMSARIMSPPWRSSFRTV